jgi:phage-related baseplate assembly protein
VADERTFPDVEFIQEDAQSIYDRMVSTWEKEMGRSLGKADPMRLHIAWEASVHAQLYAVINETAKLNVPRYAFGDYLDSISENYHWGLVRLEAAAATTTMRFTLSTASESATAVPVGTKVTKDGEVVFEVSETSYIPAGSLYADVPAKCTQTGTIGNGYKPGTINVCIDNDNVPNLESVTNLTESDGGSVRESDEDFYERMRESEAAYSTAGASAAYEYHAKSASASVGSVKAVRTAPGEVTVYIVRADGTVPEENDELLETVYNYISESDKRPLTDLVRVKPPEAVPFNVDFTWYMEKGSTVSQQTMEAAVEAATMDYIEWQTTQLGRDINESELVTRLKAAGIKRPVIREPHFTVVEDVQVAQKQNVNIVFGGIEDA